MLGARLLFRVKHSCRSSIAVISRNAASQKMPLKPATLDFDNGQAALSAKSTAELMRAYLVFRACSIPFLVHHGRSLLSLSEKVLGRRFTNWMLRKTFYGHFCAGETPEEVQKTIEKLRASGIGAILDYAAEKGLMGSRSPRSCARLRGAKSYSIRRSY